MTQHDSESPRESPRESLAKSDFLEMTHVDAHDLAGYVDNTLSAAARAAVTAHVAECDRCRHELTAIRRLVPTGGAAQRHAAVIFGAALAAAVVVMVFALPNGTIRQSVSASAESTRAAEYGTLSEVAVPFPVVSPVADTAIPAEQVVLMWHAVGADAAYRVVVQDETGGIVFTQATADTIAPVPASAFTTRAQRFFWSVEARLTDGRAMSSSVQRFRVR